MNRTFGNFSIKQFGHMDVVVEIKIKISIVGRAINSNTINVFVYSQWSSQSAAARDRYSRTADRLSSKQFGHYHQI
jgi:hypothetical protein